MKSFHKLMPYLLGLVAVVLFIVSCGQKEDRRYEITSFQTSWTTVSRGLTALDGMLWVPRIRMTVKNLGSREINVIYFRAIFLDDEGVISGDDIESVRSIPAGYAKGPVFLRGTVGYTSDFAFLSMRRDDSKKWRFNLLAGNSYSGPWTKIKSGFVEIPETYRRMR